MSLIFLLLFLACCPFLLLSAADDGAVLLKLKEELGNPDFLSSWVEGFDFCNNGSVDVGLGLFHITCTSSGRVNSLSLYFVSVDSDFPEAICKLTELESLNMAMVFGLSGPLPSCISDLVNLQDISIRRMGRNGFRTAIPEFLNNKKLTYIDFSEGGVYGPIPPSLSTSSLPKLQSVDLSSNYISGTIPWELAHNPPPSLNLNYNNMSGELPKCATWKNLLSIDLGKNHFSGDPLSLFGKDKTVSSIDLSYNDFSFDASKITEVPESLRFLDLSYNPIYGKVPESLVSKPGLSLNMYPIPCEQKIQEANLCLCGDLPLQLPPCPVLPPSPAP